MNKNGEPAAFQKIISDMKAGKTGHLRIENARKIRGKSIAATYYYAGLSDSEYSFAFSLSDTDKVFRRAQEPTDKSPYGKSYFNLLIEYNSTVAREELPGVFEYLQVNICLISVLTSVLLIDMYHCWEPGWEQR